MVQVNNEKIIIRFKFKKVGNLQYISHLDLVRTMNKIIVRADLPLWYTEGFNPKPKMVFAAPLSIGSESVCEFLDLRLTERIDPEVAKARLNANMTEQMQVIEAYYPDTAFTDLKWLSYTVLINTNGASEQLADKCNAVFGGERIEVLKNTKSGERIVDIKPLIRSAEAFFENGLIRIECILCADPSSFLNPEYVITALKNGCGILCAEDLTEESYSVMRNKAYLSDLSEFR
jgi:radical SAM-linked protein